MQKRIIWSNEIDLDDFREYIEDEFPEAESESEKWEIACEINNDYLEDERENLRIDLPAEIVIIADLGRWDGRANGYKVIPSGNIAGCLYDDCDYITWYCDRYNFRGDGIHHDGKNHYLYRVFREELTEEQKSRFLDAIYYGKCNDRMIRRYTKSIRPYIAEVYGW